MSTSSLPTGTHPTVIPGQPSPAVPPPSPIPGASAAPGTTAPGNDVPRPTTTPSFGMSVNNYLNTYINIADSKATAFVGGNLVALGVVMSQTDPSRPNAPFHLAAIALFIIAAALSTMVLFPRLPESGSGLIFWEDIRGYSSAEDYYDKVRELNPARMEQAYAFQNYQVAKVLHSKHRYLRWSIIASAVGVAAAIIHYWVR